jgi:acyl-CoA thioesterase I
MVRVGGPKSVLSIFLLCCLGLLALSACAPAASTPSSSSSTRLSGPEVRTAKARHVASAPAFAACEQRLERSPDPVVAIVGASYTAGVGPSNPHLSWAVRLAHTLRWNAVIDGVPGAGYVRTAADGQGPAVRMLAGEDLAAIRPKLVILQLGHDDIGVPLSVERRAVATTLAYIREQDPGARIALITVFTAGRPSLAALRTDQAIVSAAAGLPGVIIMDPLAQHWVFARAKRGGLHPSAAGDAWIAAEVASILRANGVLPATVAGASGPVICDPGFLLRHAPASHPVRRIA